MIFDITAGEQQNIVRNEKLYFTGKEYVSDKIAVTTRLFYDKGHALYMRSDGEVQQRLEEGIDYRLVFKIPAFRASGQYSVFAAIIMLIPVDPNAEYVLTYRALGESALVAQAVVREFFEKNSDIPRITFFGLRTSANENLTPTLLQNSNVRIHPCMVEFRTPIGQLEATALDADVENVRINPPAIAAPATNIIINGQSGTTFNLTAADVDAMTYAQAKDSFLEPAFMAPAATGNDDTTDINTFYADLSSDALNQKRRIRLIMRENQTYLTSGFAHRPYTYIDGNGARFKKISGITGNARTSPNWAVIRSLWTLKDGSWYGDNKHMKLSNVVLDGNNQNYIAIADYLNVEDLMLENVTGIASPWCLSWQIRLGGRNIHIWNPRLYGATRVFQDGLHLCWGDATVYGGYIEAGDDPVACGDDQLLTPFGAQTIQDVIYYDGEPLRRFAVYGTRVKGVRGNGAKIYRPASNPFGLTGNAQVFGGDISITGQAGLLRNGGVSFLNHQSPDNRNPSHIRSVRVTADLEVGTNGKSIHSAIAGRIVGTPTTVSKGAACTVSLPAHGLTAGKVVAFIGIPPNGMQELVGFYQVNNIQPDSFGLSDTAYRNNVNLASSSFTTWNGGQVVECSTGLNYTSGDYISPSGGVCTEKAVFQVVQVGPQGQVEAIIPISPGNYTTLPTTPNTAEGGSGTGAVLHLETEHSGINAFGLNMVGASDCEFKGTMVINDTAGSATRFSGVQILDSERCSVDIDVPSMPDGGGVWVMNEATTLKTRDNRVKIRTKAKSTLNTSYGMVLLRNSMNTYITGLLEDIPTNMIGVRCTIGGNSLESKNVTAISAADPAVFTAVGHGRKIGDPVLLQGFTLSSGSINNIGMRVKAVPSADTLQLEDLDGIAISLNGATVSVYGTIALAPTSYTAERLTLRRAAGATGVSAFNNATSTPHRVFSVTIRDCDARECDIKLADSVAAAPLCSVSNLEGYSFPRGRDFWTTNVIVDAMATDRALVRVPTSPVTIAAPLNPRKHQILTFAIRQAALAQTITWNSVFKKRAGGIGQNNLVSTVSFYYDGTNWVQCGDSIDSSTTVTVGATAQTLVLGDSSDAPMIIDVSPDTSDASISVKIELSNDNKTSWTDLGTYTTKTNVRFVRAPADAKPTHMRISRAAGTSVLSLVHIQTGG